MLSEQQAVEEGRGNPGSKRRKQAGQIVKKLERTGGNPEGAGTTQLPAQPEAVTSLDVVKISVRLQGLDLSLRQQLGDEVLAAVGAADGDTHSYIQRERERERQKQL